MKPVDWIVLIVTIPISVVILVVAIVPAITGKEISETKAELFSDMIKQIIAIVLVYVGYKLRGDK